MNDSMATKERDKMRGLLTIRKSQLHIWFVFLSLSLSLSHSHSVSLTFSVSLSLCLSPSPLLSFSLSLFLSFCLLSRWFRGSIVRSFYLSPLSSLSVNDQLPWFFLATVAFYLFIRLSIFLWFLFNLLNKVRTFSRCRLQDTLIHVTLCNVWFFHN